MKRRLLTGTFAAVICAMALAAPASAHGDHDARPVARDLPAGPHRISLWQVYPDVNAGMIPHLIVMFEDGAAAAGAARVDVAVNATPVGVVRSTTSANGWETATEVNEGDVVAVTISDGGQSWALEPVTVPPPPTTMLPMEELLYSAIFLTIATVWWAARRTARAWRRPVAAAS